MEEYAKYFEITDKTIFALGEDIYTNYTLTQDLLVHELVHLRQQAEVGLDNWIYDFLYCPDRRLAYEIEAYREQLKSIKDRNYRTRMLYESANNLSSSLYGNIISKADALKAIQTWK